jgi:hypothetical protein
MRYDSGQKGFRQRFEAGVKEWAMTKLRLFVVVSALTFGCAGGWYYWNTTVDWVNPLPVTVTSGTDYQVTISVSGGSSVDHANIHWSTMGDPRYAPDDLTETTAQAGTPGQFNFVVNLNAATATTFYVAAHAKVNGMDCYSTVTPVDVVPGLSQVTWTTLPPDPMADATDYPVEYTVTGGAVVSSVRVQWTFYNSNPSVHSDGWSVGGSGVPGLFSDTVNIDTTEDRVYRMCVRAVVDGNTYYSSVISRLVEIAAPADTYEPNDSFAEAVYIGGTGTTTTIYPYLYPSGDSDYFWISAGSGVLTIDLTSLPKDYDLFLYDSTYTLVDWSSQFGTVNESITISVAAGTYYIVVRGYREAYDTSSYTLSVDIP